VNIKLTRSVNFVAMGRKRSTSCQNVYQCGACGGSIISVGEASLRFYPDRPGLPRKPFPRLSVSAPLEHLCHKNANFLAIFKKPNLSE